MPSSFQTNISLLASLCAALSVGFAENAAAKDKTVTLSKASVLQIAYVDIKHGEKNTYFRDYFPKVEPVFNDHGGKVVAKFETFDVVEGDYTPQYVLLLEWPSLDAFDAAAADSRVKSYAPIRQHALRSLDLGLFTIEQDVSITFDEETVYEFFAANPAGPQAPAMLGQFFQSVIPTGIEYGRGGLLDLKPANHPADNYDRMIAGIATWPSAAHFYQFTNTTVFRTGAEKFRNPALAEQEIINTHYVWE